MTRNYNPGDLTMACSPLHADTGLPLPVGMDIIPVFDPLHPRRVIGARYVDSITKKHITDPMLHETLMNKYREMWYHAQRLRATLLGLSTGAPGSEPGFVLNTDKHYPNIWNRAEVMASGAGEVVTISHPDLGDGFSEAFANCFNLGNGNVGAPTPGDGFIVVGLGSLKGKAIVRDYKTIDESTVALLLTTYDFPEWNALQAIPESSETPMLRLCFRVTVLPYNLMRPYTNYCVHCIDTCLNIFGSQKAVLGGNMPVIHVPGTEDTTGFEGSDYICGAFASSPSQMANFEIECNFDGKNGRPLCSHYASHHDTGGTTMSANEMAQLYYGIAGIFYYVFYYSYGGQRPLFDYNDRGLSGIYPTNGMHLWWQEDTGFGIGKKYQVVPCLQPSTVDEMYRIHYRDVDFYYDYNPIICQKKSPLSGEPWAENGSTQREMGTADRAFDFPSISGGEGLVKRVREFERNTDNVTFPITTEIVIEDPEVKVTITPNAGNIDFVVEESRFSEVRATPLNRGKGSCLADISQVIGDDVTFLFKFGFVEISYPGVGQEGVTLKYATGGNVVQPKYLQTIWNAGSAELFGDEQAKLHPGDAIKITVAGQTIYGICIEATAFAVARGLAGNCLDDSVSQFVQPATGVPPFRADIEQGNNKCDSAVVKFEPGAVELLAAATGPFDVEYYRAAVHLPGTPPTISVMNLDDTVAYAVPPETLTSYFTQGKILFSVASSALETETYYLKINGKRYFSRPGTRVYESAAQYMLDLQKAISWWTYTVLSTIIPGGSVGGGGSSTSFNIAGTFENEPMYYDGTTPNPNGSVNRYTGRGITALGNKSWEYDAEWMTVAEDGLWDYVMYNLWNWLDHIRRNETAPEDYSSFPVLLKSGAGGSGGFTSSGGTASAEQGLYLEKSMTFPACPIASATPPYRSESGDDYQVANEYGQIENATMTYSVSTVPLQYSKTEKIERGALGYGKPIHHGDWENKNGWYSDEPSTDAIVPIGGWYPGTGGDVFIPSMETTYHDMPNWDVYIVKVTTTYRTNWAYGGSGMDVLYEYQDDPLILIEKVKQLHSVPAGESWTETIPFDAGFLSEASSTVVTRNDDSGLVEGTDVSFYVAADCPGLEIDIESAEFPEDLAKIEFLGRFMETSSDGTQYTCGGRVKVTTAAVSGPTVSASWSGKYSDDIIPGSQIFADPLLDQKWAQFYGSGDTHEFVPLLRLIKTL
jgi:hypothetical protein